MSNFNGSHFGLPPSCICRLTGLGGNRPFAQLLPGLETGHPVTVGQSPAYDFSVTMSRKLFFLSPFRIVLRAIHVQVTDRPSPDAPSLTQAIIVQMVYFPYTMTYSHRPHCLASKSNPYEYYKVAPTRECYKKKNTPEVTQSSKSYKLCVATGDAEKSPALAQKEINRAGVLFCKRQFFLTTIFGLVR